ncbi:MmgE/PrpD family protein [Martelella mangrovi]|uniref:2-methylcitrate dehydratase PrpD n=1 Tax=Martelella mangrovi TaxID=1397477 RepID=A0ABV2IBX6_9HYPH
METILEQIAARAAGGVAVTTENRIAARNAIADTLACMVAGQGDMAVLAARSALLRAGHDGASTLVGGGSADPAQAAMINGIAAHALDFDDNFGPGMSHASAVLVPALLALGELLNVSGAVLIDTYLTGLEAQALVGSGVRPEHYAAGWHATSTVGAIGTAAGCAALLGLDHAGVVQAMSLAVSSAAGMKGQFGTPAKPFHAGMAARNAVEAALLARSGLYGRADILERAQGFGALMGGGAAAAWTMPEATTPHVIETDGLMPKIHPCCGSTHNSVDMIVALRGEHGFAADDVDGITLTVGRANFRNLAYPEPLTAMEGRFSMQYCVALALFEDELSLADFTDAAVMRPHLRALFSKITMDIMPPEQEQGSTRPPHQARVQLKDGRVLTASLAHARGTLMDPLSEDARRFKLRDCFAAAGLPFDAAMQATLDDIDGLGSLKPLAKLVARKPGRSEAA